MSLGKRLLALCVVCGAMASAAMAQNAPVDLDKELGITKAQKDKMTAIRKKYEPSIVKVQEKYRQKAAPHQKALQDLQQSFQQKAAPHQKAMDTLNVSFQKEVEPTVNKMKGEIEGVLTPTQRAKLKKMEADQKAAFEKMVRERGGK